MFLNNLSRNIYSMDLSLFDGAGAGAGATGGVGGNSAGGNSNSAGTSGSDGNLTTAQQREAEINSRIPWNRLKSGKPAQLNGRQNSENATPGRNNEGPANPTVDNNNTNTEERWNTAKKGEFKSFYENDIATAVQNRVKGLHNQIDQANQVNQELQQIVDAIRIRYPSAQDNEALLNAINNDDSLIDQLAYDEGLTPEQYRENVNRERQLNSDQEELQQLRQWKVQQEQNRQIEQQLPAIMQKYPDFNINEALQNPVFARALALQKMDGNEPDLIEAYEFAYRKDLLKQQVAQTMQVANRNFTEQQIANQYLPNANNVSAGRAPSTQQLTKEKFEEAKKLMRSGKSAAHLFR